MRLGSLKALARPFMGIFDAGVVSLGNLAIGIVAARTMSLANFGLVSITMLSGTLFVGLVRNVWGDPLILGYSAESGQRLNAAASKAASSCLGSLILAAPVIGLVVMGILSASGADVRVALTLAAAMALGAPFLGTQDLLRQAAYCAGRPEVALSNSATRTAIEVGVLFVAHDNPALRGMSGLIFLWALSTIPAGLLCAYVLRIEFKPGIYVDWIVRQRALIRALLLDFGLTQVTTEASIILISTLAGAAEAGLIRKAQIPLAPLVILTAGIISVAQPALVRRVAIGTKIAAIERLVYSIGGLGLLLSFAGGIIVWLVPENVMSVLVGADWGRAHDLVLLLSVYFGLGTMAASQGVALRALGLVGVQVKVRLYLSPVQLCLVAIGASFGASTAILCLCVGVLVGNLAWTLLLRSRRTRED